MYWSSLGSSDGATGSIEKASMDGTGREMIHSNIISPIALTLDIESQTLYWIDAHNNQIESSSVDGQSRHMILHTDRNPFGIAIHNNGIYFSVGNVIKYVSDNESFAVTLHTSTFCEEPLGIEIVDPHRQLQGTG